MARVFANRVMNLLPRPTTSALARKRGERNEKKAIELFSQASEAHPYDVEDFLQEKGILRGRNGWWIRHNLHDIGAMATCVPKNERHDVMTRGFECVWPVVKRFGVRPVIEIVKALEGQGGLIGPLSQLGVLSDLANRIGIEPFVHIARNYPENAGDMFNVLTNFNWPHLPDDAPAHLIHSPAELMNTADQLNSFLDAAEKVTGQKNWILGELIAAVGFEHMATMGRVLALQGKAFFERPKDMKSGWKIFLKKTQPIRDIYGMDFCADFAEAAGDMWKPIAEQFETIHAVYPDRADFLHATREIVALLSARGIVRDHHDSLVIPRIIRGIIKDNGDLTQRFGLTALRTAIAKVIASPPQTRLISERELAYRLAARRADQREAMPIYYKRIDGLLDGVAALSSIIETEEDLDGVLRYLAELGRADVMSLLHSVRHVIRSLDDVREVFFALSSLGSYDVSDWGWSLNAAKHLLKSPSDVSCFTSIVRRFSFVHSKVEPDRMQRVVRNVATLDELPVAYVEDPTWKRIIGSFGLESIAPLMTILDESERQRVVASLPSYAHLIDSLWACERVVFYLKSGDDAVHDALIAVAGIVHSVDQLESVHNHLMRKGEHIAKDFLHAVHLVKHSRDVEPVLDVVRDMRFRLFSHLYDQYAPALSQNFQSVADAQEYLSYVDAMRNRFPDGRIPKHIAADIGAMCPSCEDMRAYAALIARRIMPTPLLMQAYQEATDKDELIAGWHSSIRSFKRGQFDPADELHRHLEFTRFRRIVDHKKVRHHIKNHITFADYIAIFDKPPDLAYEPLPAEERFEIECLAFEAGLFELFAQRIQRRAHEIGATTYVVPNLSYGYAVMAGLIPRFKSRGVEMIIGVKVSSRYSHNNKEIIDSRLFKGRRTRIMRDQPVLIVVDGTKNLVARDDGDKAARYPDAYQGYLNQVIAINDAMGFVDRDYSGAGKTPGDMAKLRATPEFQVLVEKYRRRFEQHPPINPQPYSFHFWNAAGMDLIIRNYHKRIGEVPSMDPAALDGPAIIFCSVVVLDEQIPDTIKDKYPNRKHEPGYYDDSGKIIDFEFGYDNRGVRYLNRLESELRRIFGVEKPDRVSAFVRRLKLSRRDYSSYGVERDQ